MRRTAIISALFAAALIPAACNSSIPGNVRHMQDPPTFFPGKVVFHENDEDYELPVGSTITVRLLDLTESDTSPRVIATDTIVTDDEELDEPPFAFEIRFEATETVPTGWYAVDASITGPGGRHLMRSKRHDVLTRMNPYWLRLEVRSLIPANASAQTDESCKNAQAPIRLRAEPAISRARTHPSRADAATRFRV